MENKFTIKNTFVFIVGLFLMGLGVSLSVKADLGVTPISCIPYVCSHYFSLSLGQLTIIINCLFLLLQIVILRRDFPPIQLLQLLAVSVLGYFIDLSLLIVADVQPSTYFSQFSWFLASCLIMSFGVFMVLSANIIYIPGDGLILTISKTFTKNFGKTKISFDSSMVLIGIACSLLMVHKLVGIREGTVLAAILVGYFIQIYSKAASHIQARIRNDA